MSHIATQISAGLLVTTSHGAAYVFLSNPAPCVCGRMAAIVINRFGKTRCADCDATEVRP